MESVPVHFGLGLRGFIVLPLGFVSFVNPGALRTAAPAPS